MASVKGNIYKHNFISLPRAAYSFCVIKRPRFRKLLLAPAKVRRLHIKQTRNGARVLLFSIPFLPSYYPPPSSFGPWHPYLRERDGHTHLPPAPATSPRAVPPHTRPWGGQLRPGPAYRCRPHGGGIAGNPPPPPGPPRPAWPEREGRPERRTEPEDAQRHRRYHGDGARRLPS